jgi:hypothetical protein
MPVSADPARVFDTRGADAWTVERLDRLGREELVQLAANAERLGEAALAERCLGKLKLMPKMRSASAPRAARTGRLVPRSHAFAARGVYLKDPGRSWSGTRKADGKVVFALWRQAVRSRAGACWYLLWAPNVDGARPWSDSEAGRERLEHCKLAATHASAEGMLVQGEPLEGFLPEDRARSVAGIDLSALIRFEVMPRGEEFWAVWGSKRANALSQAREEMKA